MKLLHVTKGNIWQMLALFRLVHIAPAVLIYLNWLSRGKAGSYLHWLIFSRGKSK